MIGGLAIIVKRAVDISVIAVLRIMYRALEISCVVTPRPQVDRLILAQRLMLNLVVLR